jgi:hypothetical protein
LQWIYNILSHLFWAPSCGKKCEFIKSVLVWRCICTGPRNCACVKKKDRRDVCTLWNCPSSCLIISNLVLPFDADTMAPQDGWSDTWIAFPAVLLVSLCRVPYEQLTHVTDTRELSAILLWMGVHPETVNTGLSEQTDRHTQIHFSNYSYTTSSFYFCIFVSFIMYIEN